MRHKLGHKKLNRTSEHRKALIKNMLNSLVKYEQITTTLPKAKVIRPQAEKLITIGKKDTLANTKRLVSKLQNIQTVNKIKKTLRIKDASMASAENVKNITGFSIGGVSPIGHLNKIDILIDKSLMRFDTLYAAAGHPNCVFKTNFEDLKKITNGLDEEICE